MAWSKAGSYRARTHPWIVYQPSQGRRGDDGIIPSCHPIAMPQPRWGRQQTTASLGRPRAALVHIAHGLRTRHIAVIDMLDAKAAVRDQRADSAIEMTSAREAFPYRVEMILPPTHPGFGRAAMLNKQK